MPRPGAVEDERVGETPEMLRKKAEGRCWDSAVSWEVRWPDSSVYLVGVGRGNWKKESRADWPQPLGSVWSLHNPVTRFYLR